MDFFHSKMLDQLTRKKATSIHLHVGKENYFKLGKLLENERQWQLIENTKKVQKGLS